MSRSAVRPERAVLVIAIALLPWMAVSRGEWSAASRPSSPETSAAIDAWTSQLVVASDRPSLLFETKRLIATVPGIRLTLSQPLPVEWEARPAISIARATPLALHEAGRGPPPLAAA